MANKTYYEKGNKYVNASGNPVIEKRGNQLTFTDNFDAGGGGELPVASASTLGGVKVGDGLSITAEGVLSANGYTPPAYSTIKTDTGKRWVDGSIIYQRVIEYTGAGLDVDTTGVIAEENTDVKIPVGCWSFNGVNGFAVFDGTWVEDGDLKIRGFSNLYGIKYVVIEYIDNTVTPTRTTKKTVKKG